MSQFNILQAVEHILYTHTYSVHVYMSQFNILQQSLEKHAQTTSMLHWIFTSAIKKDVYIH